MHEHIADVARRFAKLGYLAIAPELFVRQGDAQGYGEVGKLIAEVVSKVPDAQVMGDLDATRRMGAANGGDTAQARDHRLLLGRPHHLALCRAQPGASRRGVAWYGRLVGDTSALSPQQPIDIAASLQRPGARPLRRRGHRHSARDDRAHEGGAGHGSRQPGSQFVVYPDAPHAFHADYRPSYAKTRRRTAGSAASTG